MKLLPKQNRTWVAYLSDGSRVLTKAIDKTAAKKTIVDCTSFFILPNDPLYALGSISELYAPYSALPMRVASEESVRIEYVPPNVVVGYPDPARYTGMPF